MLAMTRCALILGVLMKRKDADWFEKPVPQGTEGYFEMISNPMDYGTIQTKLEAAGYPDADAFASDVRLVASNAVTYSPEADNPCNKAARAHLNEFEKQFLKQGLATDDGAAAAAAAEAAKPPKRAKRS